MLEIHSSKVWHLSGNSDEMAELLEAAENDQRGKSHAERGSEAGNAAYFRAEQYKELQRTIQAEN